MVRLKHKVEVDGGTSGRVTEGLLVWRDSIPGVFDTQVIPRWCERRYEVGEGRSSEDREHRELVPTHD